MDWSTYWAAVSAISTTGALMMAIWAMLRWKKQEELKVKLDFKYSIADYNYCLLQLPKDLSHMRDRIAHQEQCQKLVDLLANCYRRWLLTEGLLDGNELVFNSWNFIFNNHKKYLGGEIESSEIGTRCLIILNEKFVFD
ncbi:hypothetical protein [Serratia marcescens]|uniref:hypothetical protein n=2 Tax=Serratia marcescens TaxID=615 RepID=UPI002FDB4864